VTDRGGGTEHDPVTGGAGQGAAVDFDVGGGVDADVVLRGRGLALPVDARVAQRDVVAALDEDGAAGRVRHGQVVDGEPAQSLGLERGVRRGGGVDRHPVDRDVVDRATDLVTQPHPDPGRAVLDVQVRHDDPPDPGGGRSPSVDLQPRRVRRGQHAVCDDDVFEPPVGGVLHGEGDRIVPGPDDAVGDGYVGAAVDVQPVGEQLARPGAHPQPADPHGGAVLD